MKIRTKLAPGFSAIALLVAFSGYLVTAKFNEIKEVSDALNLLNPMLKNINAMAHDVDAYLLGDTEKRERFEQHREGFQTAWGQFVEQQRKHGGTPPDEKPFTDQIETLSQVSLKLGSNLLNWQDEKQRTHENVENLIRRLEAVLQNLDRDTTGKVQAAVQGMARLTEKINKDIHDILLGEWHHLVRLQKHTKEFQAALSQALAAGDKLRERAWAKSKNSSMLIRVKPAT